MTAAGQKRRRGAADLTGGPITRTLLLFALPSLGANILQSLNNTINAIWIGRLLGPAGIAATTNANLISFLLLSAVFGVGMAATVIVGQGMGAGDVQRVRIAAGTGTGLFVGVGFAVAGLGWWLAEDLLRAMGTPPETLPMATLYLRVMMLSAPASLLTNFLAMALRGVGDAVTPLVMQIPAMIACAILNPILIGGWGVVPALGIAGSALAAVVALTISSLGIIAAIYVKDSPIRLRGREWRYLIPDRQVLAFMVTRGTPMGLQMIVTSGSAIVLLSIVNRHGTDIVAGYGAANQIWVYVQMPAMALSMAVSAMAAQNIGAERWDRIAVLARSGLAISAVSTSLVLIAMLLSDQYLLAFVLPAGAAIIAACTINEIAGWNFIMAGMAQILSGIMRANGVTLVPLVIMIISLIPARLGSAYALIHFFGADAIWWSIPISAGMTLLLTAAYYHLFDWQRPQIVASRAETDEFAVSETEPAARTHPAG